MVEKILIVDDDPRSLKILQMALGRGGYALLAATDGAQALDVAMRERPSLVMLDIQLPGVDGLELIRRLRRTADLQTVPIVAVTAYAMSGDRERAIEAGCDVYLTKPIDTRELPVVVARALAARQAGNTDLGKDRDGKEDSAS